jgi:hypothetical protein
MTGTTGVADSAGHSRGCVESAGLLEKACSAGRHQRFLQAQCLAHFDAVDGAQRWGENRDDEAAGAERFWLRSRPSSIRDREAEEHGRRHLFTRIDQ